MGTLWQFFGFPDPEGTVNSEPAPKKKKKESSPEQGQQLTLVSHDANAEVSESVEDLPIPAPVRKMPDLPPNWNGLVTPDGIAFHDLSNYNSEETGFPDRALRYVRPNKMHRLPIREIEGRVRRGDTIIVDLNPLIHMETQTNACRRILQQMGSELGIAIFALDEEDKLLLVPGIDVTMDVSKNDLGLAPLLL